MFSANQKPFIICARVTSFALVLQVCTRVTEELHSFLSQSELSNFFVSIIIPGISYKRLSVCFVTAVKDKFFLKWRVYQTENHYMDRKQMILPQSRRKGA